MKLRRWLSAFLILALLAQLVPVFAAQEDGALIAADREQTGEELLQNAQVLFEQTELREQSVKHFRLDSGDFVAVSYDAPVHYLDENGQWQDYDNTLHETTRSSYRVENGDSVRTFSADAQRLVTMQRGDYSLTLSPLATEGKARNSAARVLSEPEQPDGFLSAVEPENLYSALQYDDVLDGASLRYENYANTLKESIVIARPSASYSYRFGMELVGLTPHLRDDGGITLSSEDGEAIYEIPAPYLIDAQGACSYAAAYTLSQVAGGWLLTVTADPAWVNAAAFPVTLDPTVTEVLSGTTNISATFVRAGSPAQTAGEEAGLYVGNDGTATGLTRSYVRLNWLPALPAGCELTYAQFSLYQYTRTGADFDIDLYGIDSIANMDGFSTTDEWKTWAQTLTWNKAASDITATVAVDRTHITSGGNGYYTAWDVSPLAYRWYASSYYNLGFLLRSADESANHRAVFYGPRKSSDQPRFTVVYRNVTGIEPQYTYQTQSIGRAGVGYLCDYSLQNTLLVPIASSDSETMPFALSLVYNSAYGHGAHTAGTASLHVPDYSTMVLGTGWKLSAQQSLLTVGNQLVYHDADGTEHYLRYSGGVYRDEDGLGLTVSGSTMTDDYGNRKIFSGGYLVRELDAYGNALYYCYNGTTWNAGGGITSGGNRLTSVWRKNVGTDAEQLVLLGYSGNRLSSMIRKCDFSGDRTKYRVSLTYAADGSLTEITFPDGAKAQYSYLQSGALNEDGEQIVSDLVGLLCGVYDAESKCGIEYTYSNNRDVRCLQPYVIGAQRENGRKTRAYKEAQFRTTYRCYADDFHEETYFYQLFDRAGRTVGSYSTDQTKTRVLGVGTAKYTENSGVSRRNNRLLAGASAGQQGVNLLKNSSAENGTDGWVGASRSTQSACAGGASFQPSGTMYQTVSLAAGSYTFSAYVRIPSAGNVRLELQDASGAAVASGRAVDYVTTGTGDGWLRLSVGAQLAAGSYRAAVVRDSGTVWVDCLQLEAQSDGASTYNLLEDGSFEQLSSFPTAASFGWFRSASASLSASTYFGQQAGRLAGGGYNRLLQNVTLSDPAGTTYLLSGWAKANAYPDSVSAKTDDTDPYFGLIARIYYTDATSEVFFFPYNPVFGDWQFCQGILVAQKAVSKILVVCAYDYNGNEAAFDNISLRREPAQTYRYDDNGNVVAAERSGEGSATATYSGVDLTAYTAVNGSRSTYTYNNYHDVLTATQAGVTTSYTYDTSGNRLTATRTGGGLTMQASSTMTGDRNHVATATDANGNTVSYVYDPWSGRLLTSTNGRGQTHAYVYQTESGRLQQTYQSGVASVVYSYAQGLLGGMDRKSFRSGTEQHQIYAFSYNAWGQRTATYVGQRLLSSAVYRAGGGPMLTQTYGNGDTVHYAYDTFDRLVSKTLADGDVVRYDYNAEGAVARIARERDGVEQDGYEFTYDSLGRLIRSEQYGTAAQRTEHRYDAYGRLSSQSWVLGNRSFSETYGYNDGASGDGTLSTLTAATGDTLQYGYDALRRLQSVAVGSRFTTAYAYEALANGNTASRIQYRNVRLGGSGTLLEGAKYTYDACGNITRISQSTSPFYPLADYVYDAQNQLTRETYYDGAGTGSSHVTDDYVYTYDTAGNLLAVSKNGTTTQTYTYGDTQWLDLLTAVNGEAITYDNGGNPTSYGGWSFAWQNGRQLSAAQRTEGNETTALSFAYDLSGVRRSKTYTTSVVTTRYTVTFVADGTTVKTMTVDDGYVLQTSDYPTVPAKTGYTGAWQEYTAAIHADVTVQATYTALAQHTVSFVADGVTVKTMTVTDGYILQASDYPAVPEKEGYAGAWQEYTAAITEDITIQAVYQAATHTVTFYGRNVLVPLKTMTVPDGYVLQDSDYPPVPRKVGYIGSWVRNNRPIHEDTKIFVKYVKDDGTMSLEETEQLSVEDDSYVYEEITEQQSSADENHTDEETSNNAAPIEQASQVLIPTQTIVHEYMTLSGKLARETIKTDGIVTDVMDFVYDESGRPLALLYSANGTDFTTYYYILNLQGDVVKLIGTDGTVAASYTYDAWGNILSSSGTMAEKNPLRYRGYYYDSETGYYYLQSRYYDPANRRFINADVYNSTGQGFVGTNMFAYCNNNPVRYEDNSGTLPTVSINTLKTDTGATRPDNYVAPNAMSFANQYQREIETVAAPYMTENSKTELYHLDTFDVKHKSELRNYIEDYVAGIPIGLIALAYLTPAKAAAMFASVKIFAKTVSLASSVGGGINLFVGFMGINSKDRDKLPAGHYDHYVLFIDNPCVTYGEKGVSTTIINFYLVTYDKACNPTLIVESIKVY